MNKIYTLLSLSFLFFTKSTSFAQGEQLFQDDFVHEVRLNFSNPNFWSTLITNYDNNYPHVPYIMADVISVFPNPARDHITVKFEKAPKPGTVIRLFNSVGQNLYKSTANDSETILPLANLSHGIYFLWVENRAEQLTFHKKISIN